jgi:acyl carrier protein
MQEQLITLLSEVAGIEPGEVDLNKSLEDHGLDSLDVVELQNLIEDDFGVEVAAPLNKPLSLVVSDLELKLKK